MKKTVKVDIDFDNNFEMVKELVNIKSMMSLPLPYRIFSVFEKYIDALEEKVINLSRDEQLLHLYILRLYTIEEAMLGRIARYLSIQCIGEIDWISEEKITEIVNSIIEHKSEQWPRANDWFTCLVKLMRENEDMILDYNIDKEDILIGGI
jgi:hypothetical protein